MSKRRKEHQLAFPLMVRLDESLMRQLEFLCARWGRPRGTLARQIIEDGLSELLNPQTKMGREWLIARDGQAPRQLAAAHRLPTAKQVRVSQPERVVEIRPSSRTADRPAE